MTGSDASKFTAPASQAGSFMDYLAIARLDHSTKQVFVIPGIVFAMLLRGVQNEHVVKHVILGLIAAICIASANYVINEWLDREFDRHHPTKSKRSAVQRVLSGRWVTIEWAVFVAVGLFCAGMASKAMLVVGVLFAMQGIVYNVAPLRSKDKPYLDVISESVNNPFRLAIGWLMIDSTTLPPGSIILSYWLGGAFLMAAKRLSEYRQIVAQHGRDLLVRYRASFAGYSDASLTVSCFVYAMLSSFFLAVFLLKYRIEYLITMPVVTALFGYYLYMSTKSDSAAQKPEKLFRDYRLMALSVALAAVFIIATFVDIPGLDPLSSQQFISLK